MPSESSETDSFMAPRISVPSICLIIIEFLENWQCKYSLNIT